MYLAHFRSPKIIGMHGMHAWSQRCSDSDSIASELRMFEPLYISFSPWWSNRFASVAVGAAVAAGVGAAIMVDGVRLGGSQEVPNSISNSIQQHLQQYSGDPLGFA